MNVYYSNIVANYQQRLGETSLGNVLFYDGHNLYQSIQGLNGFGSLGFLRKVFSNVGRSFKKIKGELTRKKPKYNFRKNFLRAHRANKKAFDIGFKNTKKSVVKVLPKVKKVIKIAAPIVASVAAVIPGGQVVSAAT